MSESNDDSEHVEFENDQVKVLRIKMRPGDKTPRRRRGDRVLVWLSDAHHHRTSDGQHQEIRRRRGEVAWRGASEHQIESLHHEASELIIVELKPPRR